MDANTTSGQKPMIAPLEHEPVAAHHILVVDDEEYLRRFSAEVLKRSGYRVDAAEDGAAAWDTLQMNSYDLLITDHNMPKVSGVELLKKLHAAHLALPVILVSGAMPTEELSRHPWLRIDAALVKPFSTAQLLGTVQRVLRKAETAVAASNRLVASL